MANTVKIKRSAVSGKIPLTTDLELGELALNTFDGKLYTKKDNGTVSIIQVGAGDFVGPASSTDNAIVRFDGTTGKLVQNSSVIIDDNGNVGIGTAAPKLRLQVTGAATAVAPTLGVASGTAYFTNNNDAYGLLTGLAGNGDAWLQAQRTDATATAYNILLNPSGGNIGIGTSSPTQKLDVSGGDIRLATNATYIRAVTSTGTTVRMLGINSSNDAYVGPIDPGPISTIFNASSTSALAAFYTSGTEKMRITSAGDVGIGTNVPASTLTVRTASGAAPVNTSGTNAVRLISTTTAAVGIGPSLLFEGQTGNTTASYGFAAIQGFKSSGTLNDYSGALAFSTQNGGGSTALTERMRIDGSGNVGIGTSSPAGKLQVSGTGYIFNSANADPAGGVTIPNLSGTFLTFNRSGGLSDSEIIYGNTVNSLFRVTSQSSAGVLTERMRIDSAGNVGVGVTPSAWGSTYDALEIRTGAIYDTPTGTSSGFTFNSYFNGTNWIYKGTGGNATALRYEQGGAGHQWFSAPSGAGGATVSFTNTMVLNGSGNVGIGTGLPITRLHVSQSNTGDYASVVLLSNSADTAADRTGIYGSPASGTANPYRGGITFHPGATGAVSIHTGNNTTPGAGERMRIDGTGNVGIGTASPQSALNVFGSSGLTLNLANTSWQTAAIKPIDEGASYKGSLALYTHASAVSPTNPTERMRIDSSGNVGIGTASPAQKLDVQGIGFATVDFRAPIFYDSDNTAYYIDANSTSSVYRINGDGFSATQFLCGTSNYADIADGSTWYGIGRSTLDGYSVGNKMVQVAGYYGARIRTNSYIFDIQGSSGVPFSFNAYGQFSGSVRAPIFYDSDNTGYYFDGSSTGTSINVAGNIIAAGDITANGGQVYTGTSDARVKLAVWDSSTYGIGMQAGHGHGGLDGYAMTFQMNNTTGRGFWWGHSTHTNLQGAMSLTTDGKLAVSHSVRVGFGESDLVTPGAAYALEVNGAFAATTKSFVIDHPTKPGMKLRYGSLEGPENGVYVRGRLRDCNIIELPDYWTGLVDEDSITVSLTAIGKSQDFWVEDIIDNTVVIGGENINCFYVVFAERKDVDKLEVEF